MQNLTVLQACNLWHSGAFLMETVPCVLYILMKHGNNAEEAIIRLKLVQTCTKLQSRERYKRQ